MPVATSGVRCHSITCKPGAWISQAGTDGTDKRHPAASFFVSSVNLWHSLFSAITWLYQKSSMLFYVLAIFNHPYC